MRNRWLAGLVGLVGLVGCVGMAAAVASQDEGRAWTPADSVRLRYFLYDLAQVEPLFGGQRQDNPAALSPDGRHFFFVAFSGDLERDESIGQITVFSVDAVSAALREGRASADPLRVIELRSTRGGDYQAPIIQPRWADAGTIEFVGTEGDQRKQLYHVDIRSGERVQLTQATGGEDVMQHPPGGGRSFEIVKQPGARPSLVYKTEAQVLKDGPLDMPLNQYPSAVVRTERLREDPLFAVFHPWKSWVPVGRIYARYQGGAPRLLTEGYALGPWLSPDGRYAVLGMPVTELPASWDAYEAMESPFPWIPPRQFHLVDLRTGESRALLDAPTGQGLWAQAFWSKDSSRVLLVNTRLPLSDARDDGARQAYVIDYRLADGQWTEVAQVHAEDGRRIHNAQWDVPGERVLLQWAMSNNRSAAENTLLTWRGGKWHSRSVPASYVTAVSAPDWPQGLRVYVEEDMNTPQTMVAERAGRTVALSPPDPALVGVRRQPWTRVEIDDGERRIRGYLLRPVRSGGPAPLVILVADHSVDDERFIPDGAHFGGFAGQSLAAQGFAVLHMDSPMIIRSADNKISLDESIFENPKEGPAHVRAIDAAIQQLSDEGVVDAAQVGLVGFSRSGYHVNYVITHPGRHRIGAAVIFDSYTGGYGGYVNAMAIGQNISGYPRQYAYANPESGEVPKFWNNKQGWLDAPAFNLERVRTPALFTVTGLHNSWTMLETVGGWRHMQLPFEYRMYPQGSHVLTRPREREDALRGTVEWMEFWLLDRAPADDDRARAWRSMQARWQARLKAIDVAD